MAPTAITIPAVQVTASETLRVVKMPSDLTWDEKTASLAGLISSLNAPFPGQLETVEVVYNLLQLGIPEIREATPTFTSITYQEVAPTKQDYLIWSGVEEGDRTGPRALLPSLPGEPVQEALAVSKKEAVYTALASLLFCIGKQATEDAKASVVDNRPDALIRRFGLSEGDQLILPGREAGPTREVLEAIYNSFSNYTEVRKAVIVFFLGLRHAGSHLPIHLEIMMTNFNLMKGSGMTHVEAIIKLVRMQPWVLAVPKLEPFFHKFTEDLRKYEMIDESIRPYHRLLVPQGEYLFLSSELRPLIAVAGSFIVEVEKTFSGYVYNKGVYQGLIDEVKSYVPGYTPTSSLTQLAGLLGVKEAPLPSIERTQKASKEATV